MSDEYAPATLCVHAGHRPERGGPGSALVPPLVRSTSFLLDDRAYALRAEGRADRARIYTRETNPTVEAVERRLAALEGARQALLFASGMAAMHALLAASLERGDHMVTASELYGGTRGLLGALLGKLGVAETVVDVGRPEAVERALTSATRLVLVESVANPTLAVADLPRLAAAAHGAGARLAVDATFVTPIIQRPLELGADVVHHSATKYLGGHGDLIGGVLAVGDDPDLARSLWSWRTLAGGCADPEAASLLDRGLRTLHLRMAAHSENATRLAAYLQTRPEVTLVLHPSVDTHPTREVAARLLRLSSGMVSFVHGGGDGAALDFVRSLELFLEAASLGSVESLVSLPFNLSHAHFTPEERAAMGVTPGMVRLSVGVEDADDLIADVAQALDRV